MLTIQDVERALPPQLKLNATQAFVDKLNSITTDTFAAENIRENFITYSTVLREGKFKTEDYLNAIQYVSYKLMGLNNKDSYAKTFPDRWAILVIKQASDKDISAYVAAYHKNMLVNRILEQSLIPSWLLNQDAYQKAINVQIELMEGANSEKVRCEAANSILTHIKRPETQKVQLDLGVAETTGMNELRGAMVQLAQRQLALIQAGAVTTKEIAHSILEGEYVDVGLDMAAADDPRGRPAVSTP